MKSLILLSKVLLITLLSVLLGVALLTLVYTIPTEYIQENVKESIEIFEREKTYPNLTSLCTSRLDNFTDGLMISIAVCNGNESAFNKALMGYRIVDKTKSIAPNVDLVNYYNNIAHEFGNKAYPRYWHGYLIILKPLLMLFEYGEIRVLNLIAQTIITIVIVVLMYKKKLSGYILPYVLSIYMLMPIATGFSLQYSNVFYIFSIACIILLLFYNKWNKKEIYYFYFLVIGILTAFFDLLTYPLATFGIPMILYVSINQEKDRKLLETLKETCKYLIFWGIGYAGMWAGKWILATLFTDMNVIQNAISQFCVRTSNEYKTKEFSIFSVIVKNFNAFIKTPVIIPIISYVAVKLVHIIKNRMKIDKTLLIQTLIISLLPIGWYIFASNHSYVHYWFTNRTLVIITFALMCLLEKITNNKKNKINNN